MTRHRTPLITVTRYRYLLRDPGDRKFRICLFHQEVSITDHAKRYYQLVPIAKIKKNYFYFLWKIFAKRLQYEYVDHPLCPQGSNKNIMVSRRISRPPHQILLPRVRLITCAVTVHAYEDQNQTAKRFHCGSIYKPDPHFQFFLSSPIPSFKLSN